MRDLGHLAALCPLGLDKVLDKLLGEYAACGEVVVITLERVERIVKSGGKVAELCLLLIGEVIEVHIVGAPTVLVGIDLVLDTVETCHKYSRVAEVGVAGSVGVTELKAALLGALCISGDTDDRASVRGSVAYGHGSLKAGNKSLEGVGRGVGDRAERVDVLKESAHKVVRGLGEVRVTVIIGEYGHAVLKKEHMHVHTAACLTVHGLGHKGSALAILKRGVVDDVLDHHGVVRHGRHLAELGLDLKLSGSGNLRVMVVDLNACVEHMHYHLATALV